MDVVTAFLNGNLEEEIYMKQPDGIIEPGKEHLVCKLERSLYGLKQSPRCWNKALKEYLLSIGFTQSSADPCVFVKKSDTLTVIAVYVDDLIILTKNSDEITKIKEILNFRFKMKDMGELYFWLGMSIIQDKAKKCLLINQQRYLEKVLKKFKQTEAKTMTIPVDVNVKLRKNDNVSNNVDPILYQSIIGSLLYAAIVTSPDIAHAVGVLSKICASPDESHLAAAKRVLGYLKGTKQYGIKYRKTDNAAITEYSDANWAGDLDDRQSTSGNVFMMANGPISWLSKKQATVALSTEESEYIALSQATEEAIWLRRLLQDIGMEIWDPILINEDNQGQ